MIMGWAEVLKHRAGLILSFLGVLFVSVVFVCLNGNCKLIQTPEIFPLYSKNVPLTCECNLAH